MSAPDGWEFRLSPDCRQFAFYDPGNGPWFVPEANMRGRFVDSPDMDRMEWDRFTPDDRQAIDRSELDTLLGVARLYVDAFGEDEMMTLPEKLALQDVEAIVAKYGSGGPVRPDEETT
ncbi:hypothetical protein [Streptomyces griseorubiginosus]|uniref:hypothetical protein n=1 Tax=Streptomyces griseorubiginosus TaxID=67304 RepID=UPI0036EC4A3D